MGKIGTQNQPAGTPQQAIRQDATGRNRLYRIMFGKFLHLFCDFILSKKVKKNCKFVVRVFLKNAHMT